MPPTLSVVAALVSALLSLFPRSPSLACLRSRTEAITRDAADATAQHDVPPALLLAVGFVETHLGCDRASGGCWGAPIDPQHRGTAGRASHAAQALATSYRVCGTWEGAVCRFRCGLCRCPPQHAQYTRNALSLAARIRAAADLPPNPAFTPSRRLSAR